MSKAIMFQGTGSGVGKSILCAGFCRLLSNMGFKVAPFKSQNMALNAGVTFDNLEMSRAQILQAEAAKVVPDVRMNPILLKPQAVSSSMLVRMGKVEGVFSAREYYTLFEENYKIACDAFNSLSKEYDLIVMEGAGSPSEINLHKTDIVNMRIADYAKADVFIVGDIDRGGVFAWLKGTYDLLPKDSNKLVKGFIINKFRGDKSLLQPGIEMFEKIVPKPVCGVMPYIRHNLEEEDSQGLLSSKRKANIKIGVVRLPYISNFSDFAALNAMSDIQLIYAKRPEELLDCDIAVIPSSKNTNHDLDYLHKTGFGEALKRFSETKILIGIGSGLHMLGEKVDDPFSIQGDIKQAEGLNLLPIKTVIENQKTTLLKENKGLNRWSNFILKGYEVCSGSIEKTGDCEVLSDNCLSKGKVFGTSLHGFFEYAENIKALNMLLSTNIKPCDYINEKERSLDLLAETIKENCDIDFMLNGV